MEYNVGLEELLIIKLIIRAQEVLKEVDAMRQYQVNSNVTRINKSGPV